VNANRRAHLIPLLMAVALTVGGCGGTMPRARADTSPVPARLVIPDLMALRDPRQLTLTQLHQGLQQYLNNGQGPVADQLQTLYAHWNLWPAPGTVLLLEADLDRDGTAEVITALNDANGGPGSGTLFVIDRVGDRYTVERSGETVLSAGLNATGDLTGDGRPDIIWSGNAAGTSALLLSTWQPGEVATLPTGIEATNAQVRVEGRDLVVESSPPVMLMRAVDEPRPAPRIERYRWEQGRFQEVSSLERDPAGR
jgi:hypothetical protein